MYFQNMPQGQCCLLITDILSLTMELELYSHAYVSQVFMKPQMKINFYTQHTESI